MHRPHEAARFLVSLHCKCLYCHFSKHLILFCSPWPPLLSGCLGKIELLKALSFFLTQCNAPISRRSFIAGVYFSFSFIPYAEYLLTLRYRRCHGSLNCSLTAGGGGNQPWQADKGFSVRVTVVCTLGRAPTH